MIETALVLAWFLITAELLIFGTAAFALMTPNHDGPSHFVIVLWRVLAFINLAISPLRFLYLAAAMADTTLSAAIPLVPQIMRETFAGRVWEWRFAVSATLLIAGWIPARRTVPAVMFTMSGALILCRSLTSHAIDKGALAVAILFAHQAAAGFWIGALSSLLIVAASDSDTSASIENVAPRVSRIAGWSVAMLAISGAASAYFALGLNPQLLIYSLYGRTLLWKLATAGAVLLVGGYNRFQLVPLADEDSTRKLLIRNVFAECALLAAVLAWSAILANTPPPH